MNRVAPSPYGASMKELRRFARDVGALAPIHDFVESFLAAGGIDPEFAFDVDLLIEELFTNMVKYNRGGTEEIEVGLEADGTQLRISVRDFGVESFDVTQAPPVDPEMPMSQRRRGGLGLHLVRQIADRVDYEYKDGNSTVTVTKRLES